MLGHLFFGVRQLGCATSVLGALQQQISSSTCLQSSWQQPSSYSSFQSPWQADRLQTFSTAQQQQQHDQLQPASSSENGSTTALQPIEPKPVLPTHMIFKVVLEADKPLTSHELYARMQQQYGSVFRSRNVFKSYLHCLQRWQWVKAEPQSRAADGRVVGPFTYAASNAHKLVQVLMATTKPITEEQLYARACKQYGSVFQPHNVFYGSCEQIRRSGWANIMEQVWNPRTEKWEISRIWDPDTKKWVAQGGHTLGNMARWDPKTKEWMTSGGRVVGKNAEQVKLAKTAAAQDQIIRKWYSASEQAWKQDLEFAGTELQLAARRAADGWTERKLPSYQQHVQAGRIAVSINNVELAGPAMRQQLPDRYGHLTPTKEYQHLLASHGGTRQQTQPKP